MEYSNGKKQNINKTKTKQTKNAQRSCTDPKCGELISYTRCYADWHTVLSESMRNIYTEKKQGKSIMCNLTHTN